MAKAYIPKSQRKAYMPERVPFEGITKRTNFYNNQPWRRFRAWFLRQNPMCELCKKQGQATAATEVHHVLSVNPDNPFETQSGKFGQPLDADNCQALCKPCHIQVTSKRTSK